jgi:hypothetical protein
MHLRKPSCAASKRKRARPVLFAVLLALAAGCSPSGSSPGPSARGTTTAKLTACGTASTAAGVTVHVEIAKGHVPCSTALAIEQSYARAVRSGLAPGNGGGGPVTIKGWTCQGFTTPVVDQTGDTSRCVRDGDEILEILLPQ